MTDNLQAALELVAKWRDAAEGSTDSPNPTIKAVARCHIELATELESALAQAPTVRVTDELVERAAREVWKVDRDHWLGGSAAFLELHPSDYARLLAIARAALEAALGQGKAS